MSRKFIVGGNWKCNPATLREANTLLKDWKKALPNVDKSKVDVVICPPALWMFSLNESIQALDMSTCAQNVGKNDAGAFTGEWTATNLLDIEPWMFLDCQSSNGWSAEVAKCQDAGVNVILCIGETLEEREGGKTDEVNKRQLGAVLPKIKDWDKIVIAYEPVWAIGTGKVATPDQAEETQAAIRAYLKEAAGAAVADKAAAAEALRCAPIPSTPLLLRRASIAPGPLPVLRSSPLPPATPAPPPGPPPGPPPPPPQPLQAQAPSSPELQVRPVSLPAVNLAVPAPLQIQPERHLSPARAPATTCYNPAPQPSSYLVHGQTLPPSRATLPANCQSETSQQAMLEALWRRTSAIAEDCARWNQVLRQKEKEASELAGMIRNFTEEYMAPVVPQPSHQGQARPEDAFAGRTVSPTPQLKVRLGPPPDRVFSDEMQPAGPVQSPNAGPNGRMEISVPESEVADRDIHTSFSPACTQHADSFREGAEKPETEIAKEAVESALGLSKESALPDVNHDEIFVASHVEKFDDAFAEGEGEEGELFAKVRAALSRVVGGEAASALHDPATVLIPAGWEENMFIPGSWEEKARPPPEPAPQEHGLSPFTTSVGGSTMAAEQDPSSEFAGIFPTEAEDQSASSAELTGHVEDAGHAGHVEPAVLPEKVGHPGPASAIFSECLSAVSCESMALSQEAIAVHSTELQAVQSEAAHTSQSTRCEGRGPRKPGPHGDALQKKPSVHFDITAEDFTEQERQLICASNVTGRSAQPEATEVRIQYGGSVTPDNCAELITKPNIDGFLVGGASLKPTFMDIVSKVGPSKMVDMWPKYEEKMKKEDLNESAIAAFKYNYGVLVSGADVMIPESKLDPVDKLPEYEKLKEKPDPRLLRKTLILKLNGGLGTGMGLEKAKSLLTVTEGNSFLDLIAKQVSATKKTFKTDLKFMLMNSFSTSKDTLEALSKYTELGTGSDLEFVQNKAPKVTESDFSPADWSADPGMEWCPPGHGDLYPALLGSGTLEKLLKKGYRYMFVSNSDNLGATMDLKILTHFVQSGAPFMMEVAERTDADKKGGHLAKDKATGGLLLRESAQCPEEDEKEFQNVGKYKFFNTNNLWVDLVALKREFRKNDGALPLPVMKTLGGPNSKTVDPRDKKSTKVLQLETAMGAAIQCFEGASALVIPRSRFAPVKTTNDLLALRSDAYLLTEDFTVVLAPERNGVPPDVKLDGMYKFTDAMEDKLIPNGPPSLIGCKKLVIEGPVKLAKAEQRRSWLRASMKTRRLSFDLPKVSVGNI
eukprot:s1483_g14.t2